MARFPCVNKILPKSKKVRDTMFKQVRPNFNGNGVEEQGQGPRESRRTSDRPSSSLSSSSAVEISSPKSSTLSAAGLSTIKLIQLAINGPKSQRDQILLEKLIRDRNDVAEREELRRRLAPKIGSMVQEAMACEVLRLLEEVQGNDNLNEQLSAEQIFPKFLDGQLDDTTSTSIGCNDTIIKQEPVVIDVIDETVADPVPVSSRAPVSGPQTPVVVSVPISAPLPESVIVTASEPAPVSVPALQQTMSDISSFDSISLLDYSGASNRLLELTIETEEIKGQLQVLDRQIAKCLEMRIKLLLRQSAMDVERQSLVTIPNVTSEVHVNSVIPRTLPSHDFSQVEKQLLPMGSTSTTLTTSSTTTTSKAANRKPRPKATAKLKAVKNAGLKFPGQKRAKKKTDEITTSKKTDGKKKSKNPKAVAAAAAEVEPEITFEGQASMPSQTIVLAMEPTSRPIQATAGIIEPKTISAPVDVKHVISSTEIRQDLPIQVPVNIRLSSPLPAVVTHSTVDKSQYDNKRVASEGGDADTAKRKRTQPSIDKNTKCTPRPSSVVNFESPSRRVFFNSSRNSVKIIKMCEDTLFACTLDGAIRRYQVTKDDERSINGKFQLPFNHIYIHKSRDVAGFDLLVNKASTSLFVASTDGIIKQFYHNSKWPMATFATKTVITCTTLRWNTLFIGTSHGEVLRFGAQRLQYEAALPCSDFPITCLGTSMEGACRILVVGSIGGDVNIRDAVSGLFNRWLKLKPNRCPKSLSVVQDRVYTMAATNGGGIHEIYVHNVQIGNILHIIEDAKGISSFYVSTSDPDAVYFTTNNGFIHKYSCDGRQPLKLEKTTFSELPTVIRVCKNMIVVGSNAGHLEAIVYE